MSHRTQDLPPLSGPGRIIRELRYHEGSRQVLAFVLIAWFAYVSEPIRPALVMAAPFVLAGKLLRLYASGFISKNQQLATNGPYALVRHPLYTGNILIIIGFSISSCVPWTLAVTVLFFWFYYPPAIEYEDRKLQGIFGTQWEQWSAEVPALVPSFANLSAVATGDWSLAKSARGNGEPLIVLFIVVCFTYVAWQLP
jgi:hypothetical protein